MSSAVLVQANGLGSSFQSSFQSRMSFSSAGTDWWAPRHSCLSVNSANHRSIWLSQDSLPRVRVHNVGHHIVLGLADAVLDRHRPSATGALTIAPAMPAPRQRAPPCTVLSLPELSILRI
jgi:hypothetical protein